MLYITDPHTDEGMMLLRVEDYAPGRHGLGAVGIKPKALAEATAAAMPVTVAVEGGQETQEDLVFSQIA